VKFDLFDYHPKLETMSARAEQVERGAFDGLFVAESRYDPFQPLAIAALATQTVTLGTAIALAFPRSPMSTAMSAWDLQRASGGRMVLGLGSQVRKHIEQRFGMPYGKPAARLREYVEAVRHIWRAFQGEHALDFQGDTYRLDFLPDATNPGPLEQGPPPIYLAAVGPVMFKTAGVVADGAFVHPIHTKRYLEEVAEPAIAEGLRETGRRREDFTLSITTLPIVGRGEEGAASREAMRRQFAFYASTPAYRPVLELAGCGQLGDRLRELVRAGDRDGMARAVPDEVLDAFSVSGRTWADAARAARAKYEGVADRVNFQAAPPLGELMLDDAQPETPTIRSASS
jgi:probable F420-dependent oxidoreductase